MLQMEGLISMILKLASDGPLAFKYINYIQRRFQKKLQLF